MNKLQVKWTFIFDLLAYMGGRITREELHVRRIKKQTIKAWLRDYEE